MYRIYPYTPYVNYLIFVQFLIKPKFNFIFVAHDVIFVLGVFLTIDRNTLPNERVTSRTASRITPKSHLFALVASFA